MGKARFTGSGRSSPFGKGAIVPTSNPSVTVAAPIKQAYEGKSVFHYSPTFRMACRQLESVAEVIDIDKGVLQRMSLPKRAIVVSIPVRMDDGHTEVFSGYRV